MLSKKEKLLADLCIPLPIPAGWRPDPEQQPAGLPADQLGGARFGLGPAQQENAANGRGRRGTGRRGRPRLAGIINHRPYHHLDLHLATFSGIRWYPHIIY